MQHPTDGALVPGSLEWRKAGVWCSHSTSTALGLPVHQELYALTGDILGAWPRDMVLTQADAGPTAPFSAPPSACCREVTANELAHNRSYGSGQQGGAAPGLAGSPGSDTQAAPRRLIRNSSEKGEQAGAGTGSNMPQATFTHTVRKEPQELSCMWVRATAIHHIRN